MARCGCSSGPVGACVCAVVDSDCIAVSGAGTAENPFVIEPILDPDPGNTLTCGVNGFTAAQDEAITNPPRGFASRIVPQSIPHNVETPVLFTAPDFYDTDSMHDPAVSSNLFTANTAGIYHADCAVTFDTSGAGARTVKISRVGSFLFANDAVKAPSSGANEEMDASGDMSFSIGQYFEVYVLQSSGAPLNLLNARCTWHYVGPFA